MSVNKINKRELHVFAFACLCRQLTSELRCLFIVMAGAQAQRSSSGDPSLRFTHTRAEGNCSHLNTNTSVVWSRWIDRTAEARCSPEECDKELHQVHEVTVLGEGNLLREREKRTMDGVRNLL